MTKLKPVITITESKLKALIKEAVIEALNDYVPLPTPPTNCQITNILPYLA